MMFRQSLVWLILAATLLTGCSVVRSQPTPQVIIQNAQGTPIVHGTMTVALAPTTAPNLVTNGDFRQDWTTGWTRDTGTEVSGQSVTEVIAITQTASRQAIRLIHDGPSYLAVAQRITIPSAEVVVRATINPSAVTTCRGILRTCTGAAALVLALYGADPDTQLGQLIYMYPGSDQGAFPTSSADTRFILIPPGWQTIRIDLQREIQNGLPGVDVSLVQAVEIILAVGERGQCRAGECYAEIQASDIQINVP